MLELVWSFYSYRGRWDYQMKDSKTVIDFFFYSHSQVAQVLVYFTFEV